MFGLLRKIVTLPIDVTETVVKKTAKVTSKTSDAIGFTDLLEEVDRILMIDDEDDD
jgi:hypothetical protein